LLAGVGNVARSLWIGKVPCRRPWCIYLHTGQVSFGEGTSFNYASTQAGPQCSIAAINGRFPHRLPSSALHNCSASLLGAFQSRHQCIMMAVTGGLVHRCGD
jgi:hypothetical protein